MAKPGRPKKPWYRTRNLVLVLLLVFVGWIGREVAWALTARAAQRSLFAQEITAIHERYVPRVKEGENGYEILLRLQRGISDLQEQVNAEWTAKYGDRPQDRRWASSWCDFDELALIGTPERQREAILELLRRADATGVSADIAALAATPRYERRVGATWMEWLLPDLGTSRLLARMAAARMVVAADAGDDAAFLTALDQALAVAAHGQRQPLLIDRLVSEAVFSLLMTVVSREVPIGQFDIATIDRIEALLREHAARRPPLAMAVECEWAAFRDSVDQVYTLDASGDGRLVYQSYEPLVSLTGAGPGAPGTNWQIVNLIGVVTPTRKETMKAGDAVYSALLEIARSIDADPMTNADFTGIDEAAEENFMTSIMLSALGRSVSAAAGVSATLERLRFQLAIERFRAAEGRLPADAAEVVAKGYAASDLDPFNEMEAYQIVYPGNPLFPGDDPRAYLITSGELVVREGKPLFDVYNARREVYEIPEDP